MKRYAFEQLKAWKENPNRKPLVIRGASFLLFYNTFTEFESLNLKNRNFLTFSNSL